MALYDIAEDIYLIKTNKHTLEVVIDISYEKDDARC